MNHTSRGIGATEANGDAARRLDRLARLPGQKALFAGLILVLLFSVLTIWSPDRWPISSTQVAIFLLALADAFRCTILRRGFAKSWLQFPFFAPALWGLVQLQTNCSVYRFQTWSAVLDWVTLAFAFGIAVKAFENESFIRGFKRLAIYFGALLALLAILQLFSAEGKVFWIISPGQSARPMGPFLSYDHYSAYMELLLPFALWEALLDRRRAVLFGCLAALMYASVIAGASRAGCVLISLEVAVVLITVLGRGSRLTSHGAGQGILRIASLALIFTAIVGWDLLLNRFEERDPFVVRREAWISGIAMIQDHPLVGFGLGTWTTAYPRYAIADVGAFLNAAHSDWVQWAVEGGIPFAALILIVAIRALQLGVRAPWGLGITFVFLHCLVEFPLQRQPIFLWLIVVLAALEAGRLNDSGMLWLNGNRTSNQDC